jgi:hypothetical protein
MRVALLEARDDVGDGTSKANTAILHTGFDATPGTLESRLVARGSRLLSEYAARVGIPVERTGALLVALAATKNSPPCPLCEGRPPTTVMPSARSSTPTRSIDRCRISAQPRQHLL